MVGVLHMLLAMHYQIKWLLCQPERSCFAFSTWADLSWNTKYARDDRDAISILDFILKSLFGTVEIVTAECWKVPAYLCPHSGLRAVAMILFHYFHAIRVKCLLQIETLKFACCCLQGAVSMFKNHGLKKKKNYGSYALFLLQWLGTNLSLSDSLELQKCSVPCRMS